MDARVKPGHDASASRRAGGHGGVRTNVIGSTSAHERRGTQSHAQARGISTPSLAERDRRWAAVRKEMDARGLDCLILCGWPAMWDFNIANARYLCPIGGNAEFNVLVFPRAGEPTSFIYSPVFTDYW